MVLAAALQHYNVRIKGKVEQSRELNSSISYTSDVLTIEKGAIGSPSTTVDNFYDIKYFYQIQIISKQIYLIYRQDLNEYYYSGSEYIWK